MNKTSFLDRARGYGAVARHSARAGVADLAAIYTPTSWLFGWVLRLIAQVSFFGLLGMVVGGGEQARYLVVGHACVVAAVEALLVVVSTSWERRSGTLPLLVAAPGSVFVAFLGRSLQWIPSGVASSTLTFFAVTALFNLRLEWPDVLLVPVLLTSIGLSSYAFGLALAAIVVRVPDLRNVAMGVAYLTIMAVCGVTVPLDFWPEGVASVARALPVTHALSTVRTVVAGEPTGVLAGLGAELLVMLGWLVVAAMLFRWLVASGRANGSIEFSR